MNPVPLNFHDIYIFHVRYKGVKSSVLLDPKELSTLLSLTKNGGKVYMMTH
jgi:hypothetical protein